MEIQTDNPNLIALLAIAVAAVVIVFVVAVADCEKTRIRARNAAESTNVIDRRFDYRIERAGEWILITRAGNILREYEPRDGQIYDELDGLLKDDDQ